MTEIIKPHGCKFIVLTEDIPAYLIKGIDIDNHKTLSTRIISLEVLLLNTQTLESILHPSFIDKEVDIKVGLLDDAGTIVDGVTYKHSILTRTHLNKLEWEDTNSMLVIYSYKHSGKPSFGPFTFIYNQ
jgi:hypothetical protein